MIIESMLLRFGASLGAQTLGPLEDFDRITSLKNCNDKPDVNFGIQVEGPHPSESMQPLAV